MIWFILILAAALYYLVRYAVHCFSHGVIRAAIGAIVLMAMLVPLAVIFVSIMLQRA